MDLLLIGAGRVGTAVGAVLQRRGHRVLGVASRSAATARRSSELLRAPVFPASEMPAADTILLGVPEEALETVAAKLAPVARARVVCHFAGATGIAPLQPLIDKGLLGAALHPVQACPDIETAIRRLPGSGWGMTTSAEIQSWAETLITDDLDGFPVEVAEKDRPLWHAAAVTVSNGTAALLCIGEAMLMEIGIDRPGAVLGPLAAGTVANALEAGSAFGTLTGPIVRGEARTVSSHIRALADTPNLRDAYRSVGSAILQAAISTGRLDPASARSIQQALER